MRWFVLCLLPLSAQAESLVATRAIAAKSVVAQEDVTLVAAAIPGALNDPSTAVGQEARRTIHAGQPIFARDLAPPILVPRNGRVVMRYHTGGLAITAEGRALDKGAMGDVVRVMALSSRSIVAARVAADGSVVVEGE